MVLRPFGKSQIDIDIDFHGQLRPCLVTEVLQCCTEPLKGKSPDQDFFRQLTMDKRIEALLAIATRGGVEQLTIQLNCLQETCKELMEIELSQEEIIGLQPPGDNTGTFPIRINGTDHFFRKPTGSDQLQWLNTSFANKDEAEQAMIRTLWVHPEDPGLKREPILTSEGMEAINKGMKAADPLVNFDLTIFCPACNRENLFSIDLEELLLARLHKIQLDLLHSIHRLASHYHWSEQQILSIAPHRRAYYLSIMEKEENR